MAPVGIDLNKSALRRFAAIFDCFAVKVQVPKNARSALSLRESRESPNMEADGRPPGLDGDVIVHNTDEHPEKQGDHQHKLEKNRGNDNADVGVNKQRYYNVTVHYSVSFKKLCMVTVACPFFALVICFVTAYIFQYDDIHETHCRVSKIFNRLHKNFYCFCIRYII